MLDRFDSSFSLIGWGNNPPDAIRFLDTNTHTIDKAKGMGRYQCGMYSNPKVDKLIQDSSRTLKQEERVKLMKEAQRIAVVEDQAYIPLHFQVNIHAATKKLKWVPRADNYHIYHEMELGN